MRVTANVRNEDALNTIRSMLEQQHGRPVTITDSLDYALHQTALQIDPNYRKPAERPQ